MNVKRFEELRWVLSKFLIQSGPPAMCTTRRICGSGFVAIAFTAIADLASATATTMESIGAEKCGGRVSAFEVEFLAPESAPLEATAKAVVRGAPSPAQDAVTLSVNGRPCTDARCAFQARKGETYKLAATTKLRSFQELCVVVARP